MEKTYANHHEYLHDLYRTGRYMAASAKSLDWAARSMYEKSKISKNLSRAVLLHGLHKNHLSKGANSEKLREEWSGLGTLLFECFEPIIDDLLLLSAFEIHARRRLLGKGYVIHEIEMPEHLAKAQKKEPVHYRAIKAAIAKGEVVKFAEITVSLGVLLKAKYRRHFPISVDCMKGLGEVRGRRNLVHFHMGYSWGVNESLLAFASHLDKVIPKQVVRVGRGTL